MIHIKIIEIKSYIGDQIKAGDIYLGYDLEYLNLDSWNSTFLEDNKNRLPSVILIRKKQKIEGIKNAQIKRLKFNK